MKKRSLKKIKLNKNSIASLSNTQQVKGGVSDTDWLTLRKASDCLSRCIQRSCFC